MPAQRADHRLGHGAGQISVRKAWRTMPSSMTQPVAIAVLADLFVGERVELEGLDDPAVDFLSGHGHRCGRSWRPHRRCDATASSVISRSISYFLKKLLEALNTLSRVLQ